MTMWRLLLPFLIGASGALYLGLSDYETTSIWQLFNAENFPFMILLTLAIGGAVWGLQSLALWGGRRFLRR